MSLEEYTDEQIVDGILHNDERIIGYFFNRKDGKDDNEEVGMMCNKTKEMLSKIDEFNKTAKKDLVKYLFNIGMSWEECVHYPEENKYNPKTMSSYTGEEMEKGTPVYIVSIGYEFPNTNAGRNRPIVYERG